VLIVEGLGYEIFERSKHAGTAAGLFLFLIYELL
jgi:hypothetical protein